MKIYEYKPIDFVRIQIIKSGEDTMYLTLIDTDINECKKHIEALILKQNLSPFIKGKLTSVYPRSFRRQKW